MAACTLAASYSIFFQSLLGLLPHHDTSVRRIIVPQLEEAQFDEVSDVFQQLDIENQACVLGRVMPQAVSPESGHRPHALRECPGPLRRP